MTSQQAHRVHEQYASTPLWRALEGALAKQEAGRELRVGTGRPYVLGYLCQELAARWVVTGDARTRDR